MRPLTIAVLAPVLACAQVPAVGIIDFYGLRKVPAEKVRSALGVKEGDRLPSSKGDLEARLDAVPGVVQSHLEATCCEEGKAVLYVGVEEKGATHFDLREEPAGHLAMPPEVHAAYHRFLEGLAEAVRKGNTHEDLSPGHSLISDPAVREIQLSFVELAEKHLAVLKDVLRNAEDAEQRAMAAYVIGYAPNKRAVADDLQYAMRDPDPTVRSNAMRALSAIAVYAKANPEAEVRVSYTWFVEMLNSVYWTDRNNAAVALASFSEDRDPKVLDHIRERSLQAILEMARWKHLPHALPAFIIAGRLAGLPEKEIQDAWSKGERDRVIKAASSSAPKR